MADAIAAVEAAQQRVAEVGEGARRLLRRRELTEARNRRALAETARALARQQADRAADRNAWPAARSRDTKHGGSGMPTCSPLTGRAPGNWPGAAASTPARSSWSGP